MRSHTGHLQTGATQSSHQPNNRKHQRIRAGGEHLHHCANDTKPRRPKNRCGEKHENTGAPEIIHFRRARPVANACALPTRAPDHRAWVWVEQLPTSRYGNPPDSWSAGMGRTSKSPEIGGLTLTILQPSAHKTEQTAAGCSLQNRHGPQKRHARRQKNLGSNGTR